MTYANNTAINITDVGENDNAVLCRTDLTPCCRDPQKGNWRHPNGVLVHFSGANLYRNRGDMVVRLNRKSNAITAPTGLYCCEVPTMDSPSSNEILCITLSNKLDCCTYSISDTGEKVHISIHILLLEMCK